MIMSMSRTGLAFMEGIEVLPTCSIDMMGTSLRMDKSCSLTSLNLSGH